MKLIWKILLPIFCLGLVGCSSVNFNPKAPATADPTYKVGNPYNVAGKTYRPVADPNYDKIGLASWYGSQFHGKKTANGDVFNMNALTAAHTTLPMPSYVRVTNLENNRWLILLINDRGPFVGDRLIDVSRRAAQLLGFEKKGVTHVRVQAVIDSKGELPRQIMVQKKPSTITVNKIPETAPPVTSIQVKNDTPKETDIEQGKALYIQVGAYADQRNANKVLADIHHISNTKIDRVDINGQNLYRVRVGPEPTLKLAEIILGRILSLGHNTARIIID